MNFEQLRNQLRDREVSTRLHALDEVERLPLHADQQLLVVLEALRDVEPIVRANAADLAIDLNVVAAAPVLAMILVSDGDATVRACAAEALGELADAGTIPSLVLALRDQDAAVRTFVASSLGLIGDPSVHEQLLRAVDGETSPAVALNIQLALARLGVERHPENLVELIRSCAQLGHGVEALNAINDFAKRPRRPIPTTFVDALVKALALVRHCIDPNDLYLFEETLALLPAMGTQQ